MDQEAVDARYYIVHTPPIEFGVNFFTLTPLCGYSLDYQIQIKDDTTGAYSPLPAWLVNGADLDFSVQTE